MWKIEGKNRKHMNLYEYKKGKKKIHDLIWKCEGKAIKLKKINRKSKTHVPLKKEKKENHGPII